MKRPVDGGGVDGRGIEGSISMYSNSGMVLGAASIGGVEKLEDVSKSGNERAQPLVDIVKDDGEAQSVLSTEPVVATLKITLTVE